MKQILLEINSFSYEGCLNAKSGGANRIELCSSPYDAGITPSYGLVEQVKNNIDIEVYAMVRPRGGNFLYTDEEFQIMLNDIKAFKSLGCEGIAVGLQNRNGNIDVEKLRRLVDIAWPMGVTYIRAFDLVPDPFSALGDLITCGCRRVLTSGQALYVSDGLQLIKQLVDYAGDKISIMPGSGVRPDNAENILRATGAREIHTSARKIIGDSISQETEQFGFGQGVTCDLGQIKEIRQIIDNL